MTAMQILITYSTNRVDIVIILYFNKSKHYYKAIIINYI